MCEIRSLQLDNDPSVRNQVASATDMTRDQHEAYGNRLAVDRRVLALGFDDHPSGAKNLAL
jgi:hypothetical protein